MTISSAVAETLTETMPSGTPLLVFADDWGRHPSSCQHLVARLRSHHPILWANTIGTRKLRLDALTIRRGLEKLRGWGKGTQTDSDNMWIVDLPMVPGLANPLARGANRALVCGRLRRVMKRLGLSRPVVLTTLPYMFWLVDGIERRALIYYCTDDYSHWPSADRETLRRADTELTRKADLTLAVSHALLECHSAHGTCRHFPHGVDFGHFASCRDRSPLEVPAAIASLPGPRIGFFGLIYEKIDFELLTKVAERFPGASLVLIGPKAYAPADFGRPANIHQVGPVPYTDLPGAVAGLDVLLLPYRDDPMIRQSGPLKLRECLATGKPTVSVDVPAVRPFRPHVRIGHNHESFLEQVAEALAEAPDSPLAAARQLSVQDDGWDQRARLLGEMLEEFATARSSRAAARCHA
jgi:glycosyltransferase involved in cell wall biosynthesis